MQQGADLIEVARAFRVKEVVSQGSVILDSQFRIASQAPEPGQNAHDIGVNHCHTLLACYRCYGIPCVGTYPCSAAIAVSKCPCSLLNCQLSRRQLQLIEQLVVRYIRLPRVSLITSQLHQQQHGSVVSAVCPEERCL